MKTGEGLTGLVVRERRIVAVREPQEHPLYRYFKETGEERFHSFFGVPLLDRGEPVGVLVLQTREPRDFTAVETSALSSIAYQVAAIVVNARLLDTVRRTEDAARRYAGELERLRRGGGPGGGRGPGPGARAAAARRRHEPRLRPGAGEPHGRAAASGRDRHRHAGRPHGRIGASGQGAGGDAHPDHPARAAGRRPPRRVRRRHLPHAPDGARGPRLSREAAPRGHPRPRRGDRGQAGGCRVPRSLRADGGPLSARARRRHPRHRPAHHRAPGRPRHPRPGARGRGHPRRRRDAPLGHGRPRPRARPRHRHRARRADLARRDHGALAGHPRADGGQGRAARHQPGRPAHPRRQLRVRLHQPRRGRRGRVPPPRGGAAAARATASTGCAICRRSAWTGCA